MKAIRLPALALMLLFGAGTATAQTKYYQCTDANGNRVFSQTTCGQDAQEGSINSAATMATMKPNTAPSEPDAAVEPVVEVEPAVQVAVEPEPEPESEPESELEVGVEPALESGRAALTGDADARHEVTMATLQQLDAEIAEAQRKLASYERQRDVSLQLLDDRLGSNTAADPNDAWGKILLDEKRKVQQRYDPLIRQEQARVKALSVQMQAVDKTSP